MKAYLNIEIEIDDVKTLLKYARQWEKRENYKYFDDHEALILDYILTGEYTAYSVVDSDLHLASAKQEII